MPCSTSVMKAFRIILAALIAVALCGFKGLSGGYVPVGLSQVGGSNSPNTLSRFTLQLEGVTSTNQVVTIQVSDSSAYVNMPATVTVPAGSSQVSFGATVSENPPSGWTISASCNGGSVMIGQICPPPSN